MDTTVLDTVHMDMDIPTVMEHIELMARGLLMLSPLLMLMPTTDTMVLDTVHMDMDIPTVMEHTELMARGLLMLSPLLMLMPTTDTTVLDTVHMDMDIPTVMEHIELMARGLLMLSPLLMPTITMATTATLLLTLTDMPDHMLLMAMDTDPTCGNSTKDLKIKNQHSYSHIKVKG